jgi:seryl-tRNA synthetase
MVTKYKYTAIAGIVSRKNDYSFTPIEALSERLIEIDNPKVINSITATTLKGEAERKLIEIEDTWFKAQSDIQKLDKERTQLENQLKNGDKNGNPLTPDVQANISARIADCKEGTITVEKEFYDHYTRQTHKVKEVHQTDYTKSLELRTELESDNGYLVGLRGITPAPSRPVVTLSTDKETVIRKELVRQRIDIEVGDEQDLIADMSKALSALIKQVNGVTVSTDEQSNINTYVERQDIISSIMTADYTK